MAETAAFLVERLRSEGERVKEFFNLPPDQWNQTIYTDGAAWNVRQVLAHFVASETGMAHLITNILAGGPGSPEDLNIDQYNERSVSKLASLSPADLLDQFGRRRLKTIELVSKMEEADLEKTGRHPFLGITSLREIVKLIYRHQQIHIREMRRILTS